MANESTDFAKQLEAYIDKYGMTVTIRRITDIAHAKAKDIRETWPDEQYAKAAARRWERLAAYFHKVAWNTIVRLCPRP